MKVGVVGIGAIGGWIAASLARGGHHVSALARNATLTALQLHGIGLRTGGETAFFPCHASPQPEELGIQDIVILTVKAHALPSLAPSLAPMIGPETLVVPMLNGVPWWFMGDAEPLRSVDPDETIARSIPRATLVGCVVHATASVPVAGTSELHFCDKIILGEPDGHDSARTSALRDMFVAAGVTAIASADIRTDIWYKLWGNMTMNPMSALTLATMDRLLDDPLLRELALAAMEEAREIGGRIGCPIQQSGEDRLALTRKLGAFRTSMLQDTEASRPLELDALLAAPIEIAGRLSIQTPVLRGLFGLARTMARSRGLYGQTYPI